MEPECKKSKAGSKESVRLTLETEKAESRRAMDRSNGNEPTSKQPNTNRSSASLVHPKADMVRSEHPYDCIDKVEPNSVMPSTDKSESKCAKEKVEEAKSRRPKLRGSKQDPASTISGKDTVSSKHVKPKASRTGPSVPKLCKDSSGARVTQSKTKGAKSGQATLQSKNGEPMHPRDLTGKLESG